MPGKEGKGIIKSEVLPEVNPPDIKPPKKDIQKSPINPISINTFAHNIQAEIPQEKPPKSLVKSPKEIPLKIKVSDIKHKKVWNCIIDEDLNPTDAYIKIYKYKGSREQARKNAYGIMQIVRKDLAQTKQDGVFLYSRENILKTLNTEGITLKKIAEKLNYLLDAPKNDKKNAWAVMKAIEEINKVIGSHAPTKQEIVHITPATSKDVATELFQMFENSGYMRFIEQSIKVYKQGGKPEDVTLEAEYSIEDSSTKDPL